MDGTTVLVMGVFVALWWAMVLYAPDRPSLLRTQWRSEAHRRVVKGMAVAIVTLISVVYLLMLLAFVTQ